MKPDTYFRFPGRPPCTANATASNASDSQHESSSDDLPETSRTTAESCISLTGSGTTLRCADGLQKWTDTTKEPNTCTANATDTSGSVLPPFDSSAEMAGANNPPTSSDTGARAELGTGTLTSASQSADTQTKKRGRPRKSPESHE